MICVSAAAGRGGNNTQAIKKAPLSDICCYADMPQDRSADGWVGGIICFSSQCHPDGANAWCCTCSSASVFASAVCTAEYADIVQPALHLLVLSKPAATCFSRRLNDHQHGKTGLQRLRAKPVNKKAGKVSQM